MNFYLFKEIILKLVIFEVEVIEMIDIGGFSMLCLVVKNY